MGERRDRWIRATSSELANNIAGWLLIALVTFGLVVIVAEQYGPVDWSADGATIAGFLVGILVAGVGLTLLTDRLRHEQLEAARDRGRAWHVLLVVLWVPIGLIFSVGCAPSFAQETEKNSLVGIAVTGILGSWATVVAVRELVRRWRSDESGDRARSLLP